MKQAVFLFPGQGSQEPGMGKALAEAYPAAGDLYGRARAVLGDELVDRLVGADREELMETRVAQPAVFLASMAAAEALRSLGVDAVGAAGHSLGEYSALVAAGVLTLALPIAWGKYSYLGTPVVAFGQRLLAGGGALLGSVWEAVAALLPTVKALAQALWVSLPAVAPTVAAYVAGEVALMVAVVIILRRARRRAAQVPFVSLL